MLSTYFALWKTKTASVKSDAVRNTPDYTFRIVKENILFLREMSAQRCCCCCCFSFRAVPTLLKKISSVEMLYSADIIPDYNNNLNKLLFPN